jgi:hypothetical protein
MGIRKRRRQLTTLMSRLDQRVRSVELRSISLLTTDQVNAAVAVGDATATPGAFVSASAPNQFYKIEDAYVYPKAITGSEDRVEIYLEFNLGVAKGDRLEVSGIHGTQGNTLDVDGDNFIVKALDTPPWLTRTVPGGDAGYRTKHTPTNDQRSGVVITNTYSFKPDSAAPTTWTRWYQLQTKRAIDSYSIVGTTVTLTMNAVHKFEAGDTMFINIFAEDSRAYGIDGLFVIDSVTTNTIVYKLDAGVDTPTGVVAVPSATYYVFPVAREFCEVGSTWTSTSDGAIYYWSGLRWVAWSSANAAPQDGDPPAPPTALVIESEAALAPLTYDAYAKVKISWTAPTLSESGDPLTDLAGYEIYWRRGPLEEFKSKIIIGTGTTVSFDYNPKFFQDILYYFEVKAFDSGLQKSVALTGTHTTEKSEGSAAIYPPTLPEAKSKLGTIKVTWNGSFQTSPSTTAPASEDVVAMDVYMSVVSGSFTPGPSTFLGRTAVYGSAGGFQVFTTEQLSYGTDYYIKITVSDTAGNTSPPSLPVTARITPLVDTDIIAGTLNNWPFNGGVVPAGALADGSINAASLLGPNVVTQAAISVNAIGANQIAAGAIIAGKLGVGAVTAGTIDALAITAGTIAANAITTDTIQAGAIKAVSIDADAVTAVKIKADAVTAIKIEADAVTSVKIKGQNVTADKFAATLAIVSNIIVQDPNANLGRIELRGNSALGPRGLVAFKNSGGGVANSAFRFYTSGEAYLDDVEVAGTLAVSGNITGGLIRTSSGSKRVQLNGSNNAIEFYSGSALKGDIEGTNSGIVINGNSTGKLSITGNTSSFSGAVTVSDKLVVTDRMSQFNWGYPTGSGTTFPVTRTSTGASTVQGALTTGGTSDARLKTDVHNIENSLAYLEQLRPVTFKWKAEEQGKINLGLIAQEVKAVTSEDVHLVFETPNEEPLEDPILAIDYLSFTPHLIKAVQELSAKNNELQARLDALEGK